MSMNPNQDFARLHATTQAAAANLDPSKQHPLFSRAHSFILAHKYGNGREDFHAYMNHPRLRQMDTRDAAIKGLQSLPGGVQRTLDYYRPSVPGPVPAMPGPNTTVPMNPGAYTYKPGNYSQRMSPPGMPFGTSMP